MFSRENSKALGHEASFTAPAGHAPPRRPSQSSSKAKNRSYLRNHNDTEPPAVVPGQAKSGREQVDIWCHLRVQQHRQALQGVQSGERQQQVQPEGSEEENACKIN